MSINSAAQFPIKNTLDKSKDSSPFSRMGMQGESPMTGMKSFGSMGSTTGISVPHHLSGKYSAPRVVSGGGMTGNAGISSTPRTTISGGTSSGGGMRGGTLGGAMTGGGGGDFWRIY